MNREEFLKYLESPGQLDKRSILEMHELLNEFPYFQTAHLMLLRNLYVLGNIKFDSQLKKSAAYIGNRSVLYSLLHRPGIIAGGKLGESKPDKRTEEPVREKLKDKVPEKEKPEKKEPEPADKHEKEALADVILKRIEEIKKGKEGAQEKKTSAGEKSIADKILNEFAEKKKTEKKRRKSDKRLKSKSNPGNRK